MKKKNEVFVRINTPKKAKKVKKLLDMFGEDIYRSTNERLISGTISSQYPLINFDEYWVGVRESIKNDKTEVSIKELRNLLAFEHLKEGDVVVVKNNSGKWIVKLTGNNIDMFEHSASYNLDLGLLKDEKLAERHNKIYGASFLRYATEEEKALLEDKPKLESGKWYKAYLPQYGGYVLAVFNGYNNTSYGIHPDKGSEWFPCHNWFSDFNISQLEYKEATKEEVEQALIKEANKRYKVGDKVRSLVTVVKYELVISSLNFNDAGRFGDLWVNSTNDTQKSLIFRNGKWAEIVEPSFVESSDKIKVAGENIGKRVRVIDGGSGAKGCDGKVGIIVDRSSVDFSNYGGACSTGRAECYIMTDEGYYWGLCEGYELEYLTESSPLTVTLEIKDIATLQVIQKTLKELEEKLTKLI